MIIIIIITITIITITTITTTTIIIIIITITITINMIMIIIIATTPSPSSPPSSSSPSPAPASPPSSSSSLSPWSWLHHHHRHHHHDHHDHNRHHDHHHHHHHHHHRRRRHHHHGYLHEGVRYDGQLHFQLSLFSNAFPRQRTKTGTGSKLALTLWSRQCKIKHKCARCFTTKRLGEDVWACLDRECGKMDIHRQTQSRYYGFFFWTISVKNPQTSWPGWRLHPGFTCSCPVLAAHVKEQQTNKQTKLASRWRTLLKWENWVM